MAVTVVHRALDGRRFELSGSLDLAQPFTSVVGVTVDGHLHELTAGSLTLGEELARAVGVERFDEEFAFQGGTLRVGRARHYDPGVRLAESIVVGVWQGKRHSAVLRLYRATTADLIGVLRTLGITEHDDGIALVPTSGAAFAGPAAVTKQVPGLGLLEVSTRTAEHSLPNWRGVATRAGELFRDALGDGTPYFVLAGDDTWATVMPLADTVVDQLPAVADRLALRAVG